jgi:hypothetical protein
MKHPTEEYMITDELNTPSTDRQGGDTQPQDKQPEATTHKPTFDEQCPKRECEEGMKE